MSRASRFWNEVRFGRRARQEQVPVYEALFADGSFTRKSFWSDMRRPVDPADGRPGPVRYRLKDVVHPKRSIAPKPQPARLIAGWVEYAGGRWRDGAAGDAAINDGSPLAPEGGLPEKPGQDAFDAMAKRRSKSRGQTGWLALVKRVRLVAQKRSRIKEAA